MNRSNRDPYTRPQMDAARTGAEPLGGRLDGLHAEPDAALPGDGAVTGLLRSVRAEAQEAERTRLAQEIHDGPAQALSNAIFGVELVERRLRDDPAAAAAELHRLRERLQRELDKLKQQVEEVKREFLAASYGRTTSGVGVVIAHDPSSTSGCRVVSAFPRNYNPRVGR